MMYNECLKLNLLIIKGTWLVKSFLRALRKVSPMFADTIVVKQSEGTVYEFRRLLQIYRTWHRNTHIQTSRGRGRGLAYSTSTSTSTSTPTPAPMLQGKDKNGKRACLCGSPDHSWSKCPHLFEWNRTSGFKVDDSIQKQIEDKKSKNAVIRSTLQKIRANHDNPKPMSQDSGSSSSSTTSTTSNTADSGVLLRLFALGAEVAYCQVAGYGQCKNAF